MTSADLPSVLVLTGGPDAEREVSLESAAAVAAALRAAGHDTTEAEIDEHDASALAALLEAMPRDVVFPAIHGPFGEGGPLQDLLTAAGRSYVGAGPRAARLAMDKVATKTTAAALGAAVTPTAVFDPADPALPIDLPFVLKPVREGSTIGLSICRTRQAWALAHKAAKRRARPAMIEPLLSGREVTVGVLEGRSLPLVEIAPASGVYDYQAKYERDDTRYAVRPALPPGAAERATRDALALATAIGCTDLARADFIVTPDGVPWLLEINTMPGFTSHSLVPMAARAAGLELPELCSRLVARAAARAWRPQPHGACA